MWCAVVRVHSNYRFHFSVQFHACNARGCACRRARTRTQLGWLVRTSGGWLAGVYLARALSTWLAGCWCTVWAAKNDEKCQPFLCRSSSHSLFHSHSSTLSQPRTSPSLTASTLSIQHQAVNSFTFTLLSIPPTLSHSLAIQLSSLPPQPPAHV